MSASSNALLDTALRQHPALLALGRSLAGSAGEDLVQDALLVAVRHPQPVANPLAWFRRVLKNRAVSQHRSASRRSDREERTGVHDDPESLESLTQRTQILDVLVKEWANLEAPYAETLRLRFEEGLTAREIGERQGCPTNTASWRVREGVCRLRARLDERFGDRRHWLGALAAVPGMTSGVPKAAATPTYPMKTLSLLALATTATVAVTAVVYSADANSETPPPATPSTSVAAQAGSLADGPDAAPLAQATAPARTPRSTAPESSQLRAAPSSLPVGYGVMIETHGTGMEACGEEIGELASIGRDVYAGCADDTGFDPHAKFSMEASFSSDSGTSTRTVKSSDGEPGGDALAACMEAQLFAEDIDLSAFSGRLKLMFRPLDADEESPDMVAGRAFATPPQALPELDLPWRGSPTAQTTILECIDPDCPFTRRAAPSLDHLLDEHDGTVRVAQLQMPLAMHQGARRKSQALIAAATHDQYWAAADYLHVHPGPFDDGDYRALATELGLDPDAFILEIDSKKTAEALAEQEEVCTNADARGTPTFFVDGYRMPGAVPYEALDAPRRDDTRLMALPARRRPIAAL